MLGPNNEDAASKALREFPNGFQIGGYNIYSSIFIYNHSNNI